MKRLIILASFILFSFGTPNASVLTSGGIIQLSELKRPNDWEIFTAALIQVESKGDRFAKGKTQDVGIFQITPIYVKEVNRILGEEKYTLSCRTDIGKSMEMFMIYQNYHNPKLNINKAIRLHNPGAGVDYKNKIVTQIKNIKSIYENIQG